MKNVNLYTLQYHAISNERIRRIKFIFNLDKLSSFYFRLAHAFERNEDVFSESLLNKYRKLANHFANRAFYETIFMKSDFEHLFKIGSK